MVMEDLTQVLKQGDLLIIETGAYSDRDWHGPVRMLVTMSKGQLANEYILKGVKDEWDDELSPHGFLPFLIANGYAEDVDCTGWHVGSYEFNP